MCIIWIDIMGMEYFHIQWNISVSSQGHKFCPEKTSVLLASSFKGRMQILFLQPLTNNHCLIYLCCLSVPVMTTKKVTEDLWHHKGYFCYSKKEV